MPVFIGHLVGAPLGFVASGVGTTWLGLVLAHLWMLTQLGISRVLTAVSSC